MLFSIQKGLSPELVCCPRCSCRWWSSCWCCSWWGGWTHPQLWCSRCCICWTRTWRLLDRLEVSIPTTWQGHHHRGRFWEGWHWSPARRGADQTSCLNIKSKVINTQIANNIFWSTHRLWDRAWRHIFEQRGGGSSESGSTCSPPE